MTGLYHKYNVTKADGSPVDPEAHYIVLRIDSGEYVEACRNGVISFAHGVSHQNPRLCEDLLNAVKGYDLRDGKEEAALYWKAMEELAP